MIYLIKYLLLFLFIALFASIEITTSNIYRYKRVNQLCYVFLSFGVVFFSFSIFTHSGDYIPYYYYLESINHNHDFSVQNFVYDYELGWAWMCFLLEKLVTNDSTLLMQILLIIPLTAFLFFYRKSKLPILTLAIYIAHFHWWIGVVLLRQCFATIFVFIALYNLYSDRKLINYFIFCLIATLFHSSAIIFFVLPFVLRIPIKGLWLYLSILVAFILGQLGFINSVLYTILPSLERGDVYSKYIEATRGFNILAYIEMLIVFILIKKNEFSYDENHRRFWIMLSWLSLILCGLLFKMEVASRFSSYLNMPIYLFAVPHIINSFKQRKTKVYAWCILSSYLFVYLFRFVYITL